MISESITIIKEVIAWFKGRKAKKDEAVASLMKAVHGTQAYIHDRKLHGEDREREVELVGLWTECAVLLRHENDNLSSRLKHKARSWAIPSEYTSADIKQLDIEITKIRDEADKLFDEDA